MLSFCFVHGGPRLDTPLQRDGLEGAAPPGSWKAEGPSRAATHSPVCRSLQCLRLQLLQSLLPLSLLVAASLSLAAATAVVGVVSGKKSYDASKDAAKAATQDAEAQAKLQREQIIQLGLFAQQEHFDRLRDMSQTIREVDSVAAFMNRQDRSVEAIKRKVKKDFGEDIRRSTTQTLLQQYQISLGADATIARGESQAKASKSQAKQTLLSGALNLASIVG